MLLTREIDLGEGRKAIVRELTVGEVRAWMKEAAARGDAGVDVVDEMLLTDCSIADLKRMSDLTDSTIDTLGQSQIRKIAEAGRELNPDFFGMRARLMALAATVNQV